ncbi:Fork-head transcriptional regulator 2 [Lecanosticta acicola]|uniref:Fork-head transcriptional regulator 2 n=1 Tax=Lecanosticta acicola TaxID=111012 RepID=A0AAI8W1S9_9PEZI|nr:Fork-head transcriptional regulator 2 [Lecanosticta acicola]
MATEVHATSWGSLDHGAMTATPGDVGVTEPQNIQRKESNPHEQDWADFVKNYLQTGGAEPAPTDGMSLSLLGLDENMPAQFHTMNNFVDQDPASATTSSSLSSSVCDPDSAPQPYQTWPSVHQQHMMGYDQPMYQPHAGPWYPDPHFDQPLNFGIHQADAGLGIQMPPTSNPFENSHMQFNRAYTDHEPPVQRAEGLPDMSNGWTRHEQSVTPHDDLFGEEEEREGADPADPCYAQLLYQCLKEAPDYTLSLRELYEWIAQHSQKAKDPKNRGWQNSVRHNLSMNAAFARVPHGTHTGAKKGSLWRLTEEALRDGVISTTRYRKDPKRKPERRAVPALSRQTSGAKGGRATRDATRFRQQQQHRATYGYPPTHRFRRMDRPQYSPYMSRSAEASPQPNMIPPTPASSPFYMDDPANMPLPSSAPQTPPGHFHPVASTPPPAFHLMDSKPPAPYHANFELLPLDYPQQTIFGDHDPEMSQHDPNTPTPSLMTEASFMTDDNIPPSAMMMGDMGQQTGFQ